MKGFNFPGINQEGNENMADGRSKSSAFQKKGKKGAKISKEAITATAEAAGLEGTSEAISQLADNVAKQTPNLAMVSGAAVSGGMKPRLQMKKSVKQKLIPKSRYTGRKPQSQMTDAEYNEMLSKKSKKPKLKLKKSVEQKFIKSPLKSKDSTKKIKRPKGYYKDGKKITKEEYDALAAVAKRNVSVVSKKKK